MTKPITVKQLGQYLKREITTDPFLRNIYVVGEISNLSKRNYTYFSLKEDNETISCIYFDSDFPFKEGDEIIVKGSINLFLRDSKYQIKVYEAKLVGVGSQLIELNKLKTKLNQKGYFDLDRKKSIPKYPNNIGLITGYESAAYYDFIKVLSDNNYDCNIYLYPTLVQGEYAQEDIISALTYLDKENLDLIVITRGGGSKDDLSVFNSEFIADCIFDIKTPTISAIGHEIDLSIVDLVTDLYLSTPTKAAQYIVKDYKNSIEKILNMNKNIHNLVQNKLNEYTNILQNSSLKIKSYSPEYKINNYNKDIEFISNKISYQIDNYINKLSDEINKKHRYLQNKIQELLNENYVSLLDMNNRFIKFNELELNKQFYIKNKNVKYRILVEEKIYE